MYASKSKSKVKVITEHTDTFKIMQELDRLSLLLINTAVEEALRKDRNSPGGSFDLRQ